MNGNCRQGNLWHLVNKFRFRDVFRLISISIGENLLIPQYRSKRVTQKKKNNQIGLAPPRTDAPAGLFPVPSQLQFRWPDSLAMPAPGG
jgi:hypothetical protein